MKIAENDKRRFEKKFRVTPGCWIWTAGKDQDGYGQISFGRGVNRKAHRVSYELYVGEISSGFLICHKCDNPTCVNPDHLFQGSYKENSSDMVGKGRSKGPRGERQGCAKLTDLEIIEIREATETCRALAVRYGVSHSTISRARSGRAWAHLINKDQA